MADQVTMTADSRPGEGKGEARSLRRQGRVPAIAYGAGLDATAVHVDALDLLHALSTEAGENVVLRLTIGSDTHLAMPREIHRHPVRREVLHLDFVTLDQETKVTVDVPLVVSGNVEGAVVNQPRSGITVQVLPLEVPDQFTYDVSGLELGDVVRLGEIDLPDGVELVDDPEMTAISITTADLAPLEEEEAEAETEDEGDVAEAAGGADDADDAAE